METTREDHLDWCKKRAFEYLEKNEIEKAYTSMVSDIDKHPETQGHIAIGLGISLLMSGKLNSKEKMAKFINDFC